jgi:putative ABC transport system permease protein
MEQSRNKMRLGKTFMDAIRSLLANKVRSALTILGIVIGVAAVIAMLAIGNGAQNSILGQIQSIGTNLVFVMPGGSQDANNPVRDPKPLTNEDAKALSEPGAAPAIAEVAPVVSQRVEATYSRESTSTSVYGVTPQYATVRNYTVAEGDFIQDNQQIGQATVAVIGSEVAQALFGRTQGLVGETIRISGQPFKIIGVLTTRGGSSFGSEDNQILIPLSTAQIRFSGGAARNKLDTIYVSATNSSTVQTAIDQITAILRQRHHTTIGADDFSVLTQQSILDIASSITGILTVFLGGIAGISLLVGGIGIMNIMLVSVVERTREIGLRKALGARKSDILSQFLTESAMLSLFGGVIGIILGWLISFVVGQIAASSGTPITPVVNLDAILLATLFSTAVGLFFGIYPANRAANLQPVEALRTE